MRLAFDEAQEELRSIARAFLAEHSSPEQVRGVMQTELGYDPQVWKRIGAELGWPALLVPEAYGGLGLSHVELCALLEVMGEALLCSPFFATVCLAGNALLEAGTEAQKREWLPALAEGRLRATLAWTGPAGRWDADGIGATWRRDGAYYVLDGTLRYVPDGHCADLFVVAARAPGSAGEAGVSLFAVPADARGVSRTPLPTMDQTRRQAQVELRGVTLPAVALMGSEGAAWPALRKTLDLALVALAAEQVGGAQRCLELSVDYAKQRVQFGRPIGSFQAIKHTCADMMVRVEAARSAAYYAACVAAEDGAALPVAASLAKATASDAFFACAADMLQIFGGVGFTWEYAPHLYFKRAKSTETFLADASWHRERVAGHILEGRA